MRLLTLFAITKNVISGLNKKADRRGTANK